jgi:hypothetical protein
MPAYLRISASDVFFRFAKDEDPAKLGVLLFLLACDPKRDTDFGQIGFLFLDQALGEYDVETKIGFIKIFGHDSRHFDGAVPLGEMANRFDAVMARRQ